MSAARILFGMERVLWITILIFQSTNFLWFFYRRAMKVCFPAWALQLHDVWANHIVCMTLDWSLALEPKGGGIRNVKNCMLAPVFFLQRFVISDFENLRFTFFPPYIGQRLNKKGNLLKYFLHKIAANTLAIYTAGVKIQSFIHGKVMAIQIWHNLVREYRNFRTQKVYEIVHFIWPDLARYAYKLVMN